MSQVLKAQKTDKTDVTLKDRPLSEVGIALVFGLVFGGLAGWYSRPVSAPTAADVYRSYQKEHHELRLKFANDLEVLTTSRTGEDEAKERAEIRELDKKYRDSVRELRLKRGLPADKPYREERFYGVE